MTSLPSANWLRPATARHYVPLRWCFLLALLASELLVLTVSFDVAPLAGAGAPRWLQVIAQGGNAIRVLVVASGTFLVLLLSRLDATLAQALQSAAGYRWWTWVLAHLLAFAALFVATAAALGSGPLRGDLATLALCLVLGVVVAGSWCLAVAPWWFWRDFVRRERVTLSAAALVGALAWWGAGLISQDSWRPLAAGTLSLAGLVLRLGYPDVVADPSRFMLGTPTFAVNIAPVCSGYEGMGLVTIFLALYLWLFRDRIRFPQALLLFPVAIAAAWLANVLRIAALVAIGISYSPAVAVGGFHSLAGWITFVALALGIIAVTHRLHFFAVGDALPAGGTAPGEANAPLHLSPAGRGRIAPRDSGEGGPHGESHAFEAPSPGMAAAPIPTSPRRGEVQESAPQAEVAAALLVPLLVLLGAMMVTAAFSDDFDWLYPVRVFAAAAALLWYRRVYARWDWSWSWISVSIGAAVFAMWMLLEWLHPAADTGLGDAIAHMSPRTAAFWIGYRVVGSVLLVPLVEEMAFRGYLLRRLAAPDFTSPEAGRFTWLSFLISSVAFGLLHGRWIAGTLAGMAFALAVYRRGKLGDAVVAHMTANALIAVYVLLAGAWSLW